MIGRADPDKVAAMVEVKPHTKTSEPHCFMGMTNQLGKFFQNLAALTQPLRKLLTKKSTQLWGQEQDQPFSSVKAELMRPQVLPRSGVAIHPTDRLY